MLIETFIMYKVCTNISISILFISALSNEVYRKPQDGETSRYVGLNLLEEKKCILREKGLAIYFGDSQFRRNGIFNFIISIYMLTK